MNRRGFLATTAAAILTGRSARAAAAGQTQAYERIRVVTGLRAGQQSLGWIGAEAGIFRRLGLKMGPGPHFHIATIRT